MSTATIELYKALVNAGIEETKAKEVADSIVTRDQAAEFVTKTDLSKMEARLYFAFTVHGFAVIAAVVALMQLLS